ncbi:hypothetical protein CSC28_3749 [Pseudomonas paraeruginosa]|nr:hypothetical protein CSC28_3749 [Pseudomonas paraeruginosa]
MAENRTQGCAKSCTTVTSNLSKLVFKPLLTLPSTQLRKKLHTTFQPRIISTVSSKEMRNE